MHDVLAFVWQALVFIAKLLGLLGLAALPFFASELAKELYDRMVPYERRADTGRRNADLLTFMATFVFVWWVLGGIL